MKLNVVILAAGKGTRMFSAKPKVLHELAGMPLISHVLNTARTLGADNIQVVVGHEAELIQSALAKEDCGFVLQEEQLGTGHAVQQALPELEDDALALVLYGDVPLISKISLENLLAPVHENSMAVLTSIVDKPTGLGRIIRDEKNNIKGIVEQKDATGEQLQIKEINTGVMVIPVRKLKKWLPAIKAENSQKEYYLTDVVELALKDSCEVFTATSRDQIEATGVNNRIQLAQLERSYQLSKAHELMTGGVTMLDPARFDLRGEATIKQDVILDINVILEGKVSIDSGVKIGANCQIKNCVIGKNTTILPFTVMEDAIIGSNCNIGPFARIRPGTELADEVKIGNFVETKKAKIEKGSKVNHLSYIGDSELGRNVNIGAGTITCNYDGANKFKTIIGDNVFVGSNTAIVAPVTVSQNATIGAGSTITRDIAANQLAVSRSKQANINDWQRPVKITEKDK